MNDQGPRPTTLSPSLSYDDATAAIDWLGRAFGFEKRLVVPGENDTVRHSELSLGEVVIMVSTSRPEEGRVSPRGGETVPVAFALGIDDPDTHFERAKAAGAEILRPLQDEDYGGSGYLARDPEGYQWYFGSYRPGPHWDA